MLLQVSLIPAKNLSVVSLSDWRSLFTSVVDTSEKFIICAVVTDDHFSAVSTTRG
jgi:hypothetical protein